MKDWKEQIKEYYLNIIVSIILAIVGGILGFFSTPSEILTVGREIQIYGDKAIYVIPNITKWLLAISWGLIWAILGLVIVEYGKSIIKGRREREEFLEKIDKKIDERIKPMIEYTAFYTENNTLENIIEALRKTTGRKIWIIAKFISKQLSNTFTRLKIDIEGDEYSKFSESLYKECETSIYLTSPFTPAEWFRQLYPDKADQVFKLINGNTDMKETLQGIETSFGIPSHVKSLISSNINEKRRLMILPSYKRLIAEEKVLEAFLEINKRVETRFIEKEKLCERCPFTCGDQYDFSKYDYAIFDKEIVLKWERPKKPNEKRPLSLLDLKNVGNPEKDVYEKINQIFTSWQGCLTANDVKKEITTEKEKLKKHVEEKKDLPHKLAYFTTGASAWYEIPKDKEYTLGEREIKTLRGFLRMVEEKFLRNDKWNVLHLGVGEGREIPIIIDGLGSHRINHYALIDISPELLQLAESFGTKQYEDISFTSYVLDVTEDRISPLAQKLKENGAKKNLIFLVGNGAILSNPPVFNRVKESMTSDDRLVLTLEIYEDARNEEILNQYRLSSIVNLLVQPLSILGINEDSPENFKKFMEFNYNKKDSLVEVYFLFNEWIKIQGKDSANLGFESFPDKIRIFASLRPTEDNLRKLLETNGFKIEHFECFKDEHCCGVLCSVSPEK